MIDEGRVYGMSFLWWAPTLTHGEQKNKKTQPSLRGTYPVVEAAKVVYWTLLALGRALVVAAAVV